MPDSSPPPWPPAPPVGISLRAKPVKPVAGWVSLGLTTAGWLFLAFWWFVGQGARFLDPYSDSEWEHTVAIYLYLHLEEWGLLLIVVVLAGLIAGIFGRRSLQGKIGIGLAISFFTLLITGIILLVEALKNHPDILG